MALKACWESKLAPDLKKSASNGGKVSHRVIIELSSANSDHVKSMIMKNEGAIFQELKTFSMLIAEIPASMLTQLAKLDQVRKIRKDPPVGIKV